MSTTSPTEATCPLLFPLDLNSAAIIPGTEIILPHPSAPPFVLRPLIGDLLRTRYCVPGSIFLVEGVDPELPVECRRQQEDRAVRLLLGDGELCIQGILAPELHAFVDGGQVVPGCYVRLDVLRARWVDLAASDEVGEDNGIYYDGSGNPETAASTMTARKAVRSLRRQLVYLLVEDLVMLGWDRRYLQMLSAQNTAKEEVGNDADADNMGSSLDLCDRCQSTGDSKKKSAVLGNKANLTEEANQPKDEDSSDDDGDFEVMAIPEGTAAQRRVQHNWLSWQTAQANRSLPWIADDLSRPLKLTPLRLIPNLPYKQNWMVNILAVVVSLSDVEPSHLPPTYMQRTARLADPSTTKHVLLTVFLDPKRFVPQVGSVVLLLGVKNHRFDGGCLKKYLSDRPREGTSWWVQDPWDVEWCDVAGLQRWWAGLKNEENTVSMQEDPLF